VTVTEHIRAHFLAERGVFDVEPRPPLAELRQTEWSARFEELMRNRLLMGAYRYGRFAEPGKTAGQRIQASIAARLDRYRRTGNLECLVDAANYCLLEFEHSTHPLAHFRAEDDEVHSVSA